MFSTNVLFSPVLKLEDNTQLAIVFQMGWNHQFESMSGIKWKTEFFDAYFEHGVEKCWECVRLRCLFFLKYGIMQKTVHGIHGVNPPN